ncbi:UD13 glucuronosyltransferase, partial [Catharus fuscescens]|nr:UD13 glucuronosyltransferase [Catharus fuscescens]
MALRLCFAWIPILLLLPGLSAGGKLLVVPMVGSHWLSMKEVVEELSQRGHEVVVLAPEVRWQMEMTQNYKVVTHPVTQTLEELDNAFREFVTVLLTDKPFPLNAIQAYQVSVEFFSTFFGQCKDLFHSQETLRFLNQSGFDAILNALISLLELDYCNGLYGEALKLSSEVLQRDVSLTDLLNSAAVSIMRFDFVFEYPRPVMPNMVFIGGVNCAKEKPLPKVMFLCLQIVHFFYEKSLLSYRKLIAIDGVFFF